MQPRAACGRAGLVGELGDLAQGLLQAVDGPCVASAGELLAGGVVGVAGAGEGAEGVLLGLALALRGIGEHGGSG